MTEKILHAFSIDVEEWFHICGSDTAYTDPKSWDLAPARVVENTSRILDFLKQQNIKATFFCLGWVAKKYPQLIKKIAQQGHEFGSHGYYHRLVYEQTPTEFRQEISDSKKVIEDVIGTKVRCFRAPSFSIMQKSFWAYEVLAEEGFTIDSSIVPVKRDNGGVGDFQRAPFHLKTASGALTVFPMSVLDIFDLKTVQFSGGGYLRLFPLSVLNWGFRQNIQKGQSVMAYIHPREIDVQQPRLSLPFLKRFKYYVGLKTTEKKLKYLFNRYAFGTVSAVLATIPSLPEYELQAGAISKK